MRHGCRKHDVEMLHLPRLRVEGLGKASALSRGQRLRASWECRLIQFEQPAGQRGICLRPY
ncbi:hypothetical protein P368_19450 [Comamonas thiooxydans]|nr:hypothetical protein P365_21435 [Comamonas thiooxydans]KGH08569.1 hypothetical protein P368_19450 [Comamonas thiooxydans]